MDRNASPCECFTDPETELKRFRWWTGRFHFRQDYPGKVFLALARHEEDVLALTQQERDELWQAMAVMRAAVGRVLRPDWWNYMCLENAVRHVHFHLIPRYETPRSIQGWEFRDRHWGSMHARQELPPVEVSQWLLRQVKEELAR